jgi:hypothetical protein
MKRRDLLKNLALGSGAILVLPSWANGWSGASIQTSGFFNSAEASLLSSISGTFIPEGKTEPGAVGLEVDKFLDRLIADCYDEEDQAKVKAGLKMLNDSAKGTYKRDFIDCTSDQKESMLIGFSAPSDADKKWFYDTMRRETIRGYTSSEYVMVNHYKYEMAPGYYNGCVDVSA